MSGIMHTADLTLISRFKGQLHAINNVITNIMCLAPLSK
jgi:hypothetical protein